MQSFKPSRSINHQPGAVGVPPPHLTLQLLKARRNGGLFTLRVVSGVSSTGQVRFGRISGNHDTKWMVHHLVASEFCLMMMMMMMMMMMISHFVQPTKGCYHPRDALQYHLVGLSEKLIDNEGCFERELGDAFVNHHR